MTDTSILPGAALPAAGSPPSPPDFGDEEPSDNRRRLLIVGGIALALIVVVVAYLLLKGGGSGSPASSATGVVTPGTPVASAPSTSGGGAGKAAGAAKGGHGGAGTVLPPKSHTKLSRDPFKPLVVNNPASSAGAGDVAGSATVTPAQPTAPGAVPTTPADGGAPPASLGAPLAVRLLRVAGTRSALFEVTYAHHKFFRYDVAAPSASSAKGTVFGQDFALLGIQNREVTLQVGDDTPFDLKVGVSHSV